MPKVTFGILHFNPLGNKLADERYEEAVTSLVKNRFHKDALIWLIDQGNPHEQSYLTTRLAVRHEINASLLPTNIGIAAGINHIAKLADTKYVCLVTSDVVFPEDCDKILIEQLENNPDIGQISPLSDKSEIPYQRASNIEDSNLLCLAQELTIQVWRKSIFNKIEFYEPFRACFENLDFSLQLLREGYYTAIYRGIACKHYLGECIRSGARDLTYPEMNGQFVQEPLRFIFNRRWPNICWDDLYAPELLWKVKDDINKV